MPVTMSGLSSGMDTDGLINKLVNVEAQPIKQLEIRKKNHNIRKEGLKTLGKHLEELSNAARDLFGFRAAFNEKSAVSSDPLAIEVKTGQYADKGVKKIKIIQIASAHRVSSDPVGENEVLPAGKFILDVAGTRVTINFTGGKLKALNEKIEEAAAEIISSSYLLKEGDRYILTLQSKKTGQKGEILISGDQELLKKIGLTDPGKRERAGQAAVSFERKYFSSYAGEMKIEVENGAMNVAEDAKKVTIRGLLWREYQLPAEMTLTEATRLDLDVSYREQKADDDGDIPSDMKIGPDEKVNIKGIVLEGYNINRRFTRKREEKRVFESVMGVGIVAVNDGKRTEKIYPIGNGASGLRTIPVGKDFKQGKISKIILYCNSGTAEFSNARLITPSEERGGNDFKNTIGQAQDAKLIVDGIEMTRDRNDNLNDVIKGITLTLKRSTVGEIDLNVDQNVDSSLDKIKKFVEAFNKYLDLNRELTKAAKSEKPGDYEKNLQKQGFFVGDMSLLRLEGTLKMTVGGAYPNGAEKPIKILSQIGVSTGSINAEWESIKNGKLIIDEALLRKTLHENPEGVTMFFGYDTDGDNKPDTGMAFKLVSVLKPYVAPGKNIIASKIELEDSSIKLADENIKSKEEHLKNYQDKLKKKFASMERAISQSNSQKQWMKNQFGGGDDDGKGK